MGKFLQKMFGFANRKRTKRNTGEETLDWNRDSVSYTHLTLPTIPPV